MLNPGLFTALYSQPMGVGAPWPATIAPSASWQRVTVSNAYDSAGDAALVASLIGSAAAKWRGSYGILQGETRTVAVKLTGVGANGALLTYACGRDSFTPVAAVSADSTNGSDGTWTTIASPLVHPPGGDARDRRQRLQTLPAGTTWVRLTLTNTAAVSGNMSVRILVHHLAPAGERNDCYCLMGASLEANALNSVEMETNWLAQFPGSDPIIFNYARGSQTASEMLSQGWPAGIMSGFGDVLSYVLLGNVIGNDISALQPYGTATPTQLADLTTRYNTIIGSFPGKLIFPTRITYRQYDGVTPTNQANGSLPFNVNIVDPAVRSRTPSAYDSALSIPRVDLYSAAMYNRALLEDEVHFGPYEWMRYEWARMVGARVYTGVWPVSFVELMVAAAEITPTVTAKTEAGYMVGTLPDSAAKTALLARVNAITPVTKFARLSFGASDAVTGWNRSASISGAVFADILDETAASTGWSAAWGATAPSAAGSLGAQGAAPGALFPDAVLDDYVSRSGSYSLIVSGLDNAKTYRIRAIASREAIASRITDMTIGAVTRSVDAADNLTNYATFTNVAPSGGTITLALARNPANASFVYLNAMIIEEFA